MDSSPQPLETETASDAFASLFAICISFLVLNTLFVFARFFTVLVLRRSKEGLWWDDYFVCEMNAPRLKRVLTVLCRLSHLTCVIWV